MIAGIRELATRGGLRQRPTMTRERELRATGGKKPLKSTTKIKRLIFMSTAHSKAEI